MTKEDAEAPADAEKVIALINSKLPAKTFGDAINSGQTRADPSRGRPQARTATSWSCPLSCAARLAQIDKIIPPNVHNS
jgi:hypothetical protein